MKPMRLYLRIPPAVTMPISIRINRAASISTAPLPPAPDRRRGQRSSLSGPTMLGLILETRHGIQIVAPRLRRQVHGHLLGRLDQFHRYRYDRLLPLRHARGDLGLDLHWTRIRPYRAV